MKNSQKHRENTYLDKYGDDQNDPKKLGLLQNFIKSFNEDIRVKPVSYLMSFVQKIREPKRYKLLKKSQTRLDKELDLQRFIQRMRLQISATMGLLTP